MKKKNQTPEIVEEKTYEVSCCKCGVGLKVKSGKNAYMCPKCGEILRIRVTEKLVKDISTVTLAEAFVTVDKNMATNEVKTETVVG